MALFLKGDLSPEEMKRIAKENGVKLTKDDLKLIDKMKKQQKLEKKKQEEKKSKDQIANEIEKKKKEKGRNLTKEELMEILANGNLSPEEAIKLAQENGVKLSKDDLAAIMKGKKQTK